jgi:hypothetical protein
MSLARSMRLLFSMAAIGGVMTGSALLAWTSASATPDVVGPPSVTTSEPESVPVPTSDDPVDALADAEEFVAVDPVTRAVCINADGSVSVVIVTRSDPLATSPAISPLSGGCVNGR